MSCLNIINAPGSGARVDDRSQYHLSVRKPKTTLFGFRRAKGPPGLSRYISILRRAKGPPGLFATLSGSTNSIHFKKYCCDVERGCYTCCRLPGKPGNALNEEALNRDPVFRPGTVPLLTKRPPTVTGYKGSLSCAHYHPGGSGTRIVTLSGRKNAINRPFK